MPSSATHQHALPQLSSGQRTAHQAQSLSPTRGTKRKCSPNLLPCPSPKRLRLSHEQQLFPNSLRQPTQITAPSMSLAITASPTNTTAHKLPDPVYHTLRRAAKAVLHLHVKGSTPLILLIHDRLKNAQDVRSIPSGEQLSQELSIQENRTQKSDTSGELMAASNLASYRERYAELANIAKTPSGAFLTYYHLMRDQAAHGVRYVEFRTGLPEGNAENFIEHCVRGCQEAQRDLANEQKALDFGLIILMNRGGSTQTSSESTLAENISNALALAKTAVRLREQGYPVVGVDLAGDEAQHAVTDFAPVFDVIHAYNADPNTPPNRRLGITIHAGETQTSKQRDGRIISGYDSVAEAVRLGASQLTPLRIGHGIGIMQHPVLTKAYGDYQANPACLDQPGYKNQLFESVPLLAQLKTMNICLETCPKSNYQTGAVASYSAHPALFLAKLGLAINVSPDNTIISKTDATNEFVKLFKYHSGYRPAPENNRVAQAKNQTALFEFLQFMNASYRASINAAFTFDDAKRQELLAYRAA